MSLSQGGITWSYKELDSLVFYLCNVYNSKEFNPYMTSCLGEEDFLKCLK